jgi:uncharacterized lipoprotein YehR (DUF1307 family)
MTTTPVVALVVMLLVAGCGDSNNLEKAYTPAMRIEDAVAAQEHARICASAEERAAHPEEQCGSDK